MKYFYLVNIHTQERKTITGRSADHAFSKHKDLDPEIWEIVLVDYVD